MAPNAPSPAFDPDDSSDSVLQFPDNRLLIDLCGEFDRNLARIEQGLGVDDHPPRQRAGAARARGDRDAAARVLRGLYARLEQGRGVGPGDVDAAIRMGAGAGRGPRPAAASWRCSRATGWRSAPAASWSSRAPRRSATTCRRSSATSWSSASGPAGTGKTYLAVAVAVAMFIDGHVDKIILSRPAVEAGERLGFLPGDMREKVDPYMQPLYDALNDFFPARQVQKMIEERQIEIAPLAFMRGRTLANAYVVLDEAQNATTMQMKMFLTRLGEGSRMAVTGDPTQIDLPRGVLSGVIEAERVLRGVDGIAFTRFTAADVVRHPLVARIIRAYEAAPPHNA